MVASKTNLSASQKPNGTSFIARSFGPASTGKPPKVSSLKLCGERAVCSLGCRRRNVTS